MTAENSDRLIKSSKSEPSMKVFTECPICGKENSHIVLKNHLFTERELDIDLRPKEIIWLAKDIRKIVPRLYYIWLCGKCKYASGHPFYKNPTDKYTMTINKFRDRFLSACMNDPETWKTINILTKDINFDQLDYFQAIKLHLLAIFECIHIPEISNKDAMNLGRYCLRLAWLYRDVNENEELKTAVQKELSLLIPDIKKVWPEVPGNEKSAHKLALKYYHVTHEKSYVIKSAKDEIMLLLLMTRIYLTVGDLQVARKMILTCKEKAIKFDSQRKQEARSSSDERATQLSAENRKINLAIEEVQNIIDDIIQKKEEKLTEKAKQIMKKLSDKKPAEVRHYLLEKKFPQKIVDSLIPKKKGFLGFFK